MADLTSRTFLPHPQEAVFGWHERPGAFQRLTPPSFGRVESESRSLEPGSTAVLRIHIPGTRLPIGNPASLRWVARHTNYEPPHSFSDVIESGPLGSWQHDRQFLAVAGGTELVERVHYEVPGHVPGGNRLLRPRLEQFFAYRGRVLTHDLDFHATYSRTPRNILIAGASGLIGTQLTALLTGGGHHVRRLVRRSDNLGSSEVSWDPAVGRLDPQVLDEVDVVINLAGHPIGGRFTRRHLDRVRQSRLDTTGVLARALAERSSDGRQRALINASASGYYGADRRDEVLTEAAIPGRGALAEVVRDWEAATEAAAEAGVRVAVLRTGIVQSPAGGQLGVQLPLFTWGVGGPLGHGEQWMPWVTLDDVVYAYGFLALTDASGPFNCAPNPVTGNAYARTLAEVVHRPALLRVPKLGPAVLLGREGAEEFALAGQRMTPERLTEGGFTFRFPELAPALAHVLSRTTTGPSTLG